MIHKSVFLIIYIIYKNKGVGSMINKFKCLKIIKTMEKYSIEENNDSIVLCYLNSPVRIFTDYERLLNHLQLLKYLDIV